MTNFNIDIGIVHISHAQYQYQCIPNKYLNLVLEVVGRKPQGTAERTFTDVNGKMESARRGYRGEGWKEAADRLWPTNDINLPDHSSSFVLELATVMPSP